MNDNKQMKLILERWDRFVLNEQNEPVFKKIPKPSRPINTVGELRVYFKENASENTMARVVDGVKELASKYPVATGFTKAMLIAAAVAIVGAAATAAAPALVATGAAAAAKGVAVAGTVGASVGGVAAGAVATEATQKAAEVGLDIVNNAIVDTMVDTLGLQLMAIPDADRGSWGQIANLFDINDKVFNFLYQAYGKQVPKEMKEASEQLRQEIKNKLKALELDETNDDLTIDEVFGGVDTIQQRVDAFIQANHQVKIQQA